VTQKDDHRRYLLLTVVWWRKKKGNKQGEKSTNQKRSTQTESTALQILTNKEKVMRTGARRDENRIKVMYHASGLFSITVISFLPIFQSFSSIYAEVALFIMSVFS